MIMPDEEWSTPTLFLSDLHLCGGERDEQIIRRLLIATGIEGGGVKVTAPTAQPHRSPSKPRLIKRVVLLGDIFDFNLGYHRTIFRAHLPFLFCLHQLKNAGVDVVIFTGNHDPDPSPVLRDDLSIPIVTHALSVNIYGYLTLLEHGDLLESGWLKRTLCRGARHSWICTLARLVPPAISWWITQRWGAQAQLENSDLSAENDQEGHLPSLEMIFEEYGPRIFEQGYHYWVFGHFHQARIWRHNRHLSTRCEGEAQETESMSPQPSIFVRRPQSS